MSVPHLPCWGAGQIFLFWGRHCVRSSVLGALQDPAPTQPLRAVPSLSIWLFHHGQGGSKAWEPWEAGKEGQGRCQVACYRLRTIRARRPRLIAKPRVAPLNGARTDAALYSLPLHRSPWQQCMAQEPLVIWPCWLWLETHESAHSFFTRFPDRVFTARRRGKGIRPGLPHTLAPTEHPPLNTATINVIDPFPVSSLLLIPSIKGYSLGPESPGP